MSGVDRMDLLAHWNEQPCPATAEDGRRCVLDIQHSAAHVWEPGETEVESLRRQLKGAVAALRKYGWHDGVCPATLVDDPGPCECGWDDAATTYLGEQA